MMINIMMTYTTIPVKKEVKRKLELLKGDRDWSDFLSELAEEVERVKRDRAFKKLREEVLPYLDEVEESHRRFRREFSLDTDRH